MRETLTMERIQEAVSHILSHVREQPEIGLILGSGLGALAETLEDAAEIPYEQIPHFPVSTVPGHAGRLAFGKMQGQRVVVMKGRFHLYEGYSPQEVAFPVRVMKFLGVRVLVVTNAAGGVNTAFRPGDLMLIRDHINLMFTSPLLGANDERLGPRFPDMSEAYSARLREAARRAAMEQGIELREGVYCGMLGPTYETPAEVRMLRTLGADAVGMSTVPEVIAARHAGLEVLGISCITNMAAGILPSPLSHEEVMETSKKAESRFSALLLQTLRKL